VTITPMKERIPAMMKTFYFYSLFFLLLVCPLAGAEKSPGDPAALVVKARQEKEKANFSRAISLFEEARTLYRNAGNMARDNELAAEIGQMTKIMLEYTMNEAELFKSLRAGEKKMPLSEDELRGLIAGGSLESMTIDGEKKYFSRCINNVFFRDPSLAVRVRAMTEGNRKFLENYRWLILNPYRDPETMRHAPYYEPRTFVGEAELKFKKEHLPSKGTLKVWVPYPVSTTSQTDVQLLEVSRPEWLKGLSDADADIGALYFEIPLPLKEKKLEIKYRFTNYAVSFQVDPAMVGDYDRDAWLYRYYTRSDANCTITPGIRALAEKIAAGEKNPWKAARKFYDFVVDEVKYSLMPHLTLGVLGKSESVYVYEHRYGDCGAQSLFFAALCRSLGIPARTNGGMQLAPGQNSCHFWAQCYIPNYGWIPVDTSVAQAVLENRGLSSGERARIRDFFFGSMDPYRFYIQKETDLEFVPPKPGPRLIKLAFQIPDAWCEGAPVDPSLLIEYETEFERTR